ncbi:rhodanese-like domain-containing protein [Mycolicibacterium sp.]|uniref:sulfurtransferase n=1 Tax=Mycolicibacterium sp. TaxID=2320850 RepID=UPI001A2A39D1|nr:rhodanese-like domain-containing protein [Mycolicibacterium sp.]MBJ7339268.1 sulfurtransferase [Mycolicibacterium sp.]
MSTPFITTKALDQLRTGATPPTILDATLLLPAARVDGDFRAESGRALWEQEHIPGSMHVEVDSQLSAPGTTHFRHPTPQALADALARIGIGQRTDVAVYDVVGGLWAARVWFLLRWIGVPVLVLDGGLTGWRDAGLPLDAGPGSDAIPVPRWPARAVRNAWVELDDLRDTDPQEANLVCGLSPAAFTGSEPTRYSRRGHIPGSLNVPARALFDDGGFVRDGTDIATRYRDAGVDLDGELLLYCGGGISATANALALSSIGIQHARVYDGSLEEWSADPVLPLVTC